MSRYQGRRDFRPGRAFTIGVVLSAALFATGAVMTYRDRGWHWVSIGLMCATAVGLGGIIEAFVLRVRLTEEALLVTDLRGRKQYLSTEIAGVSEEKGAPTSIRLVDGRWVRLPSVGSSMGNSIRAWLKSHKA
jgi:hypothetical protein